MKKDYYSILGVTKDSTLNEIKAAYRKLALKFHPDKNPGDPFFEKMFLEVKEAYDYLNALHTNQASQNKSSEQGSGAYSKDTEKKQSSDQTDASQIFETVLINLKNLQSQSKNKTKNTVKSRNYLNYINRILSDDLVKLVQKAEPQKRKEFIFAILPLLSFFQKKEGESLLLKIISIAGPDNSLIHEIDKRFKENNRKQVLIEIANGIFENRGIIIFSLVVAFVVYFTIIDSGNSRDVIVDSEPELALIDPIEKISKWAGNKLNTGDSPYNDYFGSGVYDQQYSNEVTIHNGQKADVVVCLVEHDYPKRTIRNEYIRAGESFKLTSVPNGLYSLKWFYGNNWNPDTLYVGEIKGFFDNDAGFSKSDSPSDLLKMEQNDEQFSVWEITLYAVQNGNMETKEINPNEFFKKN